MKKILCLLVALCLLMLCACNNTTPDPTDDPTNGPTNGPTDGPTSGNDDPTDAPTSGNDDPTDPPPTSGNNDPTDPEDDDKPIDGPIISGDGPTDINFDSEVSALEGDWNLSKVYIGDTAHDAVPNAITLEITLEEDPYELVDGVAYIHNIVYNPQGKLNFGIQSIVDELEADDIDGYKGSSSWEDFVRGEVVADGGTYKQPGPFHMQFRDIDDYGLYLKEIAGIEDDIDTTNKRLIVGMNKAGQLLVGYSEEHIERPGTEGEWVYVLVFDKA